MWDETAIIRYLIVLGNAKRGEFLPPSAESGNRRRRASQHRRVGLAGVREPGWLAGARDALEPRSRSMSWTGEANGCSASQDDPASGHIQTLRPVDRPRA